MSRLLAAEAIDESLVYLRKRKTTFSVQETFTKKKMKSRYCVVLQDPVMDLHETVVYLNNLLHIFAEP